MMTIFVPVAVNSCQNIPQPSAEYKMIYNGNDYNQGDANIPAFINVNDQARITFWVRMCDR